MKKPRSISVIVPVLRDDAALESLLRQFEGFDRIPEIIVSDGSERGTARDICRRHGVLWLHGERGRGIQMNMGARAGNGDVLWFLHADSVVSPASLDAIERSLDDPGNVGGAFRFLLREHRWYSRLLERGVALRCRWFNFPYGDQGFFVRRQVFEAMGGFAETPFLEDVDFIRRLRGFGKICILQEPIGISSRRWDREGFFYATVRNWLVTIAFLLGASPGHLVRWYRTETEGGEEMKMVKEGFLASDS
jgi:hypothetical protein